MDPFSQCIARFSAVRTDAACSNWRVTIYQTSLCRQCFQNDRHPVPVGSVAVRSVSLTNVPADTEDILRRFTRDNAQHPTYRALAALGEACKTAFLCRYLRLPALRREIHEGLQVVENWNSVNGFIYFARGGEIASNRVDDQEVAMLCLHLLQICLVYVNTLMVQQVLNEPEWRNRLTAADWRGLTPLFFTHINPYGTFKLDMNTRLPIEPQCQGPGQETLQLHLYDEQVG
jgi:hypothetical protein